MKDGLSLREETPLARDSHPGHGGTETVQDWVCTCVIQGNGPERSWNPHRDQDSSTNTLSSKHSNLNIK